MRLKQRNDFDQSKLTGETVRGCLEHIKALIDTILERHGDLKDENNHDEVFGIFDEIEYETARVAIYLNESQNGWWFI